MCLACDSLEFAQIEPVPSKPESVVTVDLSSVVPAAPPVDVPAATEP